MMLPKCRPQSCIAVLSLACVVVIVYAFISKLVYVSQTCINCSSRYQTSAYEIWPPYVSTYNYRQGWFQNRCIKAGSDLSIANLGVILHDWHLSQDLDCRDLYKKFNTIYNVSVKYAFLTLPKPFQDKVRMWLGNNAELFHDVYNQVVIHIVNQFTREHTIFNPLRDKRPLVSQDQQESKYFENILKKTASTCDFCNFKENTAEHSFHRLESEHSFSASNVFKLDPLHAIFALKQHDPIHWSQEEFMDLAQLTVKWFKKAHEYFPDACYPSLIWDVLPKCGASQVHPHMQGFLSNDRYHGVVEAWRLGAQDYYRQTGSNFYTDMAAVASGLGLAISLKSAIAFASIVPRKDHEIVIMAPKADEDFFKLLYYVLKAFVDDFGKFCFSMGMAYPALDRLEAKIPAYARIITRGVVTEIRADISSFELFTDEYQANHPIKSNKSFESEKQIVPWARMPTSMLGICSEPALQHKKRVDGPPTSLSSNYYDTTNAYYDEYSLLGQQEKFAPNVCYQPKRKSEKINSTSLTNKSSEVKELKQDNKPVMNKTEIRGEPQISVVPSKTPISPPPAPRKLKNAEEFLIKEGLRDKNLNSVLGKQSTTGVKDDTSPSRKMKKMTDHMETSPEKTTDKPVDFALKYKARLAPFHDSKKTSEYKNQFFWKTGYPASPLLTAEQILHNNSAQILPDKVGKNLAQKSEYQAQFKRRENSKRGLVSSNLEHGLPDNQDQKIRRSKSVDAITSTDPNPEQVTSDTSILDKSLNEHATHKPPLEYGKLKQVVSEYQANFQSPMHHSYEYGIWRKAYPPHLLQKMNRKFSDKDPAKTDAEVSNSNWFAEVLELRERANEYKRRAQGTHFSREHLVQLLAQQTGFWDVDSARSTSSLDALALEAGPVTIADLNARQKKKGARTAENMNAYLQPADQAVQTEPVIFPKTYKDKQHKMNETQHKSKKMAWAETQTETKDEVISESKVANMKTKNLTLGQPVIDQSDKYGNEEMNNEETENQGRLSTPVLRHLKKQKTRHHLDRTTPCVKGILLSTPNDMQMPTSTSDDGNEVISNDYSLSEKQTSMENLSTSPMFGKPTSDTHILRDEDSSTDLPMQTKYIASPPKNIFDKKKIPNKHLQKPFQIPFTIDERMGETYNKLEPDLPIAEHGDSDADDVLSVSMRSVASSSSLASEVYQRAQKRRDEFWDKKK